MGCRVPSVGPLADKIRKAPGVQDQLDRLNKRPEEITDARPQKEEKALVESSLTVSADGVLTAVVPLETTSEINQRAWKAKNRRTGKAWAAVSKLFGPCLEMLQPFGTAYAVDQSLYVVFTRLGGKRLDRSNLPTATKATEDALCFLLGANDGDPRWHPTFEQCPGGPMGVKIEMRIGSPI